MMQPGSKWIGYNRRGARNNLMNRWNTSTIKKISELRQPEPSKYNRYYNLMNLGSNVLRRGRIKILESITFCKYKLDFGTA